MTTTAAHAVLMRRAASELRESSADAAVEYVARWLDVSAENADAGRCDVNAVGLASLMDQRRTYPAPAAPSERMVRDMALRLGITTTENTTEEKSA